MDALILYNINEAEKFGDPEQAHFHPQDRALALRINSLDFAIRVSREDNLLIARRKSVPQ